MNKKKIYCFDLDGTITTQEILPLIASELDMYEEISTLTQATISGLIPFESSFKLRCKLLSDIPVSRVQEITKKIKLNKSIQKFISNNKENSCIITGNIYEWIEPIVNRLGCKVYCSKAKFKKNKLVKLIEIAAKEKIVKLLKKKNNTIISIGDGMGDVTMFQNSDISIAFGGVHEPIKTLIKNSDYITYDGESLCRLLNTL